LIVIANRLPVTCSKDQQGRWKLQISAGGLVSALMGVNNYSTIWIGWPGGQQQAAAAETGFVYLTAEGLS
jgi:trehalose-6-phosphate synthase